MCSGKKHQPNQNLHSFPYVLDGRIVCSQGLKCTVCLFPRSKMYPMSVPKVLNVPYVCSRGLKCTECLFLRSEMYHMSVPKVWNVPYVCYQGLKCTLCLFPRSLLCPMFVPKIFSVKWSQCSIPMSAVYDCIPGYLAGFHYIARCSGLCTAQDIKQNSY